MNSTQFATSLLKHTKISTKTNHIARTLSISSLAIVAATGISTTPAGAVTFTTGELDIGVFTSSFANQVNPVSGNTFSVNFTPSTPSSVTVLNSASDPTRPLGSFSPLFSQGTLGVNTPAIGNFSFVSGSTYRLTNDLVFNFANNVSYTIKQNTTFTDTPILNAQNILSGYGFQLANSAGTFFTSGADITNVPTPTFSFNDAGLPTGGLYIGSASPVGVPEPFTVIGSIIGGTAAFRMRKKLTTDINK